MTSQWFCYLTPLVGILSGIAGAAYGWPLVGPGILAIWIAAGSFRITELSRRLSLATVVALVGAGLETAMVTAGVYLPEGSLPGSVLCPLWIIACWFSLGIALPTFLPQDRMGYMRRAVLGAAAAPLIYLAADDLVSGAIHLRRPLWPTLILIALLWQGILPGLCWLARWRWYRT